MPRRKMPPEWHREWRAKNRRACAINRIKYMFGVTKEEATDLYDRSLGNCDVCGGKDEFRNLNIDHCHKTDKIRGVLCHGCNIALGLLRDDPVRIHRLADYAG